MKRKIITAIPEVFSLRGNDYSSFVIKGGADTLMRNNWKGVGRRLDTAITKVGRDVEQQKKKAA